LLVGAPTGAGINATSGVFSWTPSEAQGPGDYAFTVRVGDGVANTDRPVTLRVTEVNAAPVLSNVPSSATIPELQPYTFDADATDGDIPAQTLTFSLVGAPTGAGINATSGVFSWTPSEAQGPGDYAFTVRVGDGVANTDRPVTLRVTEVPLEVSINDVTVKEGNSGTTYAYFTVSLVAGSSQAVVVNCATQDGTADASDYVPWGGQLTISPGHPVYPMVPVRGDKLYEDNETFFVNVTDPSNGALLARGIGTIINDDPKPSMTISGIKKREGNFGTTEVDFVVTLSKVSGRDTHVDYFTKDGTAKNASDYTAGSGMVTIPAGAKTAKIPVWVNGDTKYEGDETFQVVLTSPDGATIPNGKGKATGTILNDDKRRAAAIQGTLVQQSSMGIVAYLVATLSPSSAATVAVEYASAHGTAVPGSDYAAVHESKTIPAASLPQPLSVPSDLVKDSHEVPYLELSGVSDANLLNRPGRNAIRDGVRDSLFGGGSDWFFDFAKDQLGVR
jgi:hypothetical protein